MDSFDRLLKARIEKQEIVKNYLIDSGVDSMNYELKIVGLKLERILYVYARSTGKQDWKLIVEFIFSAFSGTLGPKFKEGDKQIPEGLYKINRFNSNSKFHLSLGLNYPNEEDLKRAGNKNPGSDIFIHGGAHSVGCIAIGNDKIEELYLLALASQSEVSVSIFPFKLMEENLDKYGLKFPEHQKFWKSLFNFI